MPREDLTIYKKVEGNYNGDITHVICVYASVS